MRTTLVAALLLVACDGTSTPDGGGPDAAARDGGGAGVDAGPDFDGGPDFDAGRRDAGPPAAVVTPDDPGDGDVALVIDTTADDHPISEYIYGSNQPEWDRDRGRVTLARSGGNRWSAYNWETNASNAGSDYMHQNDGYLGGGDAPGGAIRDRVEPAHAAGAAALVTVPILGYVSADKNGDGDVAATPSYLTARFHESRPGPSTGTTPDTSDAVVYQDQMVRWIEQELAPGGEVFYSLDNEPGLWGDTHARLRPTRLTYAEHVMRSVDFATAVRSAAPDGLIFGPVSYGWQGMVNLQDAPDAGGEDYLDRFLREMSDASDAAGARLLDVLDVHWYPEARGDGQRIVGDGSSDGLAAARAQAPRSLWDPSYTESSWITDVIGHPIALIPYLRGKIDARYPGTRISISEYYYGGGDHISGGLAQAAVLGVFGREDVFAAALWHIGSTDDRFIHAAFAMFRDVDGAGTRFGDRSARATTDDDAASAVFASTDTDDATRVVVVAINRSGAAQDARIAITHRGEVGAARAWQLTAAMAAPVDATAPERVGVNAFRATLPPMSVTTFVFVP
ncbi:MAG: endoglucanase A [Sandaracinaceae bacterium]|nr:endoglucanase A [Sandaracinaceae bacterium]